MEGGWNTRNSEKGRKRGVPFRLSSAPGGGMEADSGGGEEKVSIVQTSWEHVPGGGNSFWEPLGWVGKRGAGVANPAAFRAKAQGVSEGAGPLNLSDLRPSAKFPKKQSACVAREKFPSPGAPGRRGGARPSGASGSGVGDRGEPGREVRDRSPEQLFFPNKRKLHSPLGRLSPPPPAQHCGARVLEAGVPGRGDGGWPGGTLTRRLSLEGAPGGANQLPQTSLGGHSPSSAAASEAQQSRARNSMAPPPIAWIRSEFGGHQPPQV